MFTANHLMLMAIAFSLSSHAVSEPAFGQTAKLRIQFKLDGNLPDPPEKFYPRGLGYCNGMEVSSGTSFVDVDTKGIAGVVVYADFDRGDTDAPPPSAAQQHSLQISRCDLNKTVIAVQAGDTLKIKNLDPIQHKLALPLFENRNASVQIPAKSKASVRLGQSQPSGVYIHSQQYPWIDAHLYVLPHRFYAVSNENGEIEIDDLPVGEISFRTMHPGCAIDMSSISMPGLFVGNKRFGLQLAQGLNDLGVVQVSADSFYAE